MQETVSSLASAVPLQEDIVNEPINCHIPSAAAVTSSWAPASEVAPPPLPMASPTSSQLLLASQLSPTATSPSTYLDQAASSPPLFQPQSMMLQQALQQQQQQQQPDLLTTILTSDAAFSAAVKKGDVSVAAAAASKIVKDNLTQVLSRLKSPALTPGQPGLNTQLITHLIKQALGSSAQQGPGRRPSDSGAGLGRLKRLATDPGSEYQPSPSASNRHLKAGDRVIVRSINKGADTELVGQEGVVNRVEHNGWVDLTLPNLGRTAKIQQRYVVLASQAAALGITPRARASTSPQIDDTPSQAARNTDGGERTSARGASKVRDIVRTIRSNMLALEEAIPWTLVESSWRKQRPTWRLNVKFADSLALVSELLIELHEALLTDKTRGVFKRGGEWEKCVRACGEDAGSCAVMQQCWQEMLDGVKAWLTSQQLPGALVLDKNVMAAVHNAYATLESAAESGSLNQVSLDKILGNNREHYTLLKNLINREAQALMDGSDAKPELGASDAVHDVGHASFLRCQLQAVQMIPNEVDTDMDDGPDATDSEEDMTLFAVC